MKITVKHIKPRDPASHLKVVGALATRAFTPKSEKTGRKAKHKKALNWAD